MTIMQFIRNKKGLANQLLLILLVIILAVIPLFLQRNAKFEGADDQAEKAINEVSKNYKPWFAPLWKPPSTEVESFLFALQAAIGAGAIGYILGYLRGKKCHKDDKIDDKHG